MRSIFVVLDNGIVHHFGYEEPQSRDHYNHCDHCDHYQVGSGSFVIGGHKIQSIALGYYHSIMVTMRGTVLGFGCNNIHQLGVVDPGVLSGHTVLMPTEVFVTITQFKEADRLPNGKEL
jgi:alpha-tubulin suppressor-like RCC1 family protein